MKITENLTTQNRYSMFDTIGKATAIKVITDTDANCEYHKLIQTGELGVYDYGVGFLNFEISLVKVLDFNKIDFHYQVRIWIANIDDSDFGGWSKPMEKSKALKLVKSIAENVMKDMTVFPSKDRLNAMLREYGLFVDYE